MRSTSSSTSRRPSAAASRRCATAASRSESDARVTSGRPTVPGSSRRRRAASSMRSSWLYFATRSERDGAPVLICPQPVATARSAIVTSSVSPERCDITARVAGLARHRDRGERLGQRADLVDLDEDRVGHAGVDAAPQALGVGDEEVVADELHVRRRAARSAPPSRPSPPRPCRPRSRRSGSGPPGRPSSRPAPPALSVRPSCSST